MPPNDLRQLIKNAGKIEESGDRGEGFVSQKEERKGEGMEDHKIRHEV